MRILHAPHAYEPVKGGAELICRRVGEELAARGHEVRVLTTNVGSVEDYYSLEIHPVGPAREMMDGVDVRRVPYGDDRLGAVARALMRHPVPGVTSRLVGRIPRHFRRRLADRFTAEIRAFAPDVVMTMPHLIVNVQAVLAARSRLSFPLVMVPMLHEDDPDWPRDTVRDALTAADAVIANTDQEGSVLSERYGVPEDRVHVGWAGVEAPAELSGGARAPAVLYVGRKTLKKGVGELIEAMRLVWQEEPRAELVLAGARTSDAEEIARRIATLPAEHQARVRSVDDVSDAEKARLLESSCCLVLPSVRESFGVAIIEAWAYATPAVTYDLPVFRSFVRDRETGLLTEPSAPGPLASAILELLRDEALARRLGEAGRRTVLEKFTWPAVAQRYLHAYERAVAVHAARR